MILIVNDDFDLKKIAESGQCFRWNELEDGRYRIIAGRQVLLIRKILFNMEMRKSVIILNLAAARKNFCLSGRNTLT